MISYFSPTVTPIRGSSSWARPWNWETLGLVPDPFWEPVLVFSILSLRFRAIDVHFLDLNRLVMPLLANRGSCPRQAHRHARACRGNRNSPGEPVLADYDRVRSAWEPHHQRGNPQPVSPATLDVEDGSPGRVAPYVGPELAFHRPGTR